MIARLPKAALVIALPILAVPAFAQDEQPAPTQEEQVEEAEEKAEEKKICKRIAADAASRRRTKVCRTREEWKNFNRDQRRRRN
ncbi:MAG: hypothetical protein AAF249_01785 [Pseudomonadota bacterium]